MLPWKALPNISVMEELDTVPTVEELSKAIDCLTSGKAPAKDGILPEVLEELEGSTTAAPA